MCHRGLGLLGLLLAFVLAGCAKPSAAEDVYEQGVTALGAGDKAGARVLWVRALESDPTLLEAHLNLAALDLEAGETATARTRLEALGANGGADDPRARYLLAVAQLQVGERASAIASLESLADQNFPEAYYLLGSLAVESGDHADGQFYLEKYQKLRPEGGFARETSALMETIAGEAVAATGDLPVVELIEPEVVPEAIPVEPSPVEAPPTTPTPAPVVEPKPEPAPDPPAPTVPKPKPAPKEPASTELTKEERTWRDARFLMVVKEDYAAALETFRTYLREYPTGPHASGAQSGIVTCEAALKGGEAAPPEGED